MPPQPPLSELMDLVFILEDDASASQDVLPLTHFVELSGDVLPHLLKCVSTLLQLRYHEWDVAFEEEFPLSEGFQLQLFHPLLLSSLSSQKGRELREKVRGEECLASQMFILLSSLQGYALLQQPTIAQSIREALLSLYLERRDECSCPVYCS